MDVETLGKLAWQALSKNPLLERLFMASLEFAVLAGLVWGMGRLLLRRRPRIVALLWVVVMANAVLSLAFDAPLTFTVFTSSPQIAAPTDAGDNIRAAAGLGEGLGENAPAPFAFPGRRGPDTSNAMAGQMDWFDGVVWTAQAAMVRLDAVLIHVWLIGAAVFALLALRDRLRLWQLLQNSEEPNPDLLRSYRTIAAEVGVKREPRLGVTRILDSPAIVGTFRTVILVPAWMVSQETPARLAWVLRHELTHAKLGDPLFNALSQFMRILYFFHPAAWWVKRRWESAMELACDHTLVRSEADVREYLETLHAVLTSIRSRRGLRLSCGISAVRSQLGRRVAALVCMPVRPTRLNLATIGAIGAFAVIAMSVGGHIAPAVEAEGPTLWPAREVLEFPQGRSMGNLYTQPFGLMVEEAWEPLQEARGTVSVPDGCLLRLELSREALRDLAPLARLSRHDIQSVVFRSKPRDWAELRHLEGFSLWELKFRARLAYGGGAPGQKQVASP